MSESPSPEPQEPRTATITIAYGSESRTLSYKPSDTPWARMHDIESLEREVGDHLFDLICGKVSDNLSQTI